MVGQWDAGTAQKNRFVLFLDSASVTIYPPQHLPQGTGFSDNKPLVLLPFCPQRTFSVSCTWWFILVVRFPRLLLSKISRYSRADQRDHPADASTASFSQILWSRGICRLGMPRQCGRAFILWWFSASLQHLQLLTNVIMVWWHKNVELCQWWMKINQKQRSRVEKYQIKWNQSDTPRNELTVRQHVQDVSERRTFKRWPLHTVKVQNIVQYKLERAQSESEIV